MEKLNTIGINNEKAKTLADKLNILLANYQIFYINTRGLHWNIKGKEFFELHAKFEELYSDLQVKNDELAERVLTLGYTPYHSYTDYLKHASIKEEANVTDGTQGVKSILAALRIILTLQREILELSGDADDEGTNALMSDYIREQEKLVWMYTAYLG
ncbi:Dps family protein [Cytophagaceae bacterium ABcell3]|nr:Dps family protein [Cytophagaceae bacterium ABcell3]